MPKQYPPKSTVVFLFAENIRQEADGKMTILGLFTGDDIVFPNTSQIPISVPLAILLIFKDGEGKFRTSVRISAPSGKVIAESDLSDMEKKPNQNMSLVLQFGIFVFEEFGTYTAQIKLDNKEYNFPIVCRKGS